MLGIPPVKVIGKNQQQTKETVNRLTGCFFGETTKRQVEKFSYILEDIIITCDDRSMVRWMDGGGWEGGRNEGM